MNDPEVFQRLSQEKDAARREAMLLELCDSDEQREEMRRLLAADAQESQFFEDPVLARQERLGNTETELVRGNMHGISIGSQIGPYKLLQEIGEGGMGLVYMAEQQTPVKRRVALKVIKPGMDSRQVIARFEAERQALAMMDHPNIAKVLDAGTTEGGYPYFVMELVNGSPVTEYCDHETLSTRQRLELFISVCRAVQHAHQKGVIHRDLKPNNILVSEYDGVPVPKVIDFGVAKATGLQLTEKTVFTEFGQIIGTVEYMSPEQARRNQLDVDTRSDIYSLGIVLFQLLTGETPFGSDRFRKAALDEIIRIVHEEEPPLPSVKIGSSQSLEQIAKFRCTEPSRLSRLVRGDLDWIVAKTLEKDRNRRYPSAGELADDVMRHLNSEAVSASPQSSADRLLRWAGKKRRHLAAALLGFIGLMMLVDFLGNKQDQLDVRNSRIEQGIELAQLAFANAQKAPIGQEHEWQIASLHCNRVREAISDGVISGDVRQKAEKFFREFDSQNSKRQIAIQIEETLLHGASQTKSLEAWQVLSERMKAFFLQYEFDLDNQEPMELANRIREHEYSDLWADLLELWIGAKGHMASIGGPAISPESIKPWAEALYAADEDELRTAIRKFLYSQPRDLLRLKEVVAKSNLDEASPRTLSWLATCYVATSPEQQDVPKMKQLFELALSMFPQDVMLNFDYAITLESVGQHQEAAQAFSRCVALRGDVAGFWQGLARNRTKLGDEEGASSALLRADAVVQSQTVRLPREVSEQSPGPIELNPGGHSYSAINLVLQILGAAIVGALLALTTKR